MYVPREIRMEEEQEEEEEIVRELEEEEIQIPKKRKSPVQNIFETLHMKRVKVSETDSVPVDLDLEDEEEFR